MRTFVAIFALFTTPAAAQVPAVTTGTSYTERAGDATPDAASPVTIPVGSARVDEVSFRLLTSGAAEEALRILLGAYPFADGSEAERGRLVQRLLRLLEARRDRLPAEQLSLLRRPLDTPALRTQQAIFLAEISDCEGVRAVLGAAPDQNSHDDWVRVGHCAAGDPGAARGAYRRAHELQPGGQGTQAYAYAAFAAGDYRQALEAWRSVPPGQLREEQLLAAATTALAAGEAGDAGAWLETYRLSASSPGRRYWSLYGQAMASTDVRTALLAFERAVALEPNADDYFRLARLHDDPRRQVEWLERAAGLDSRNAQAFAELGYARLRAGRHTESLQAFERSAALDPANAAVQAELGFGYWRAGREADAQAPLERSWQEDPTNVTVAKQLVYVHQRRAQNDEARRYIEHVLDSPDAFETGGSVVPSADADLQFALRRLHEDLGRRVTVNLDSWTGTRLSPSPAESATGRHFRSYSQVEADVRLGTSTVRNGKTLSAFARVFADGGDAGSILPSGNATLGVGLRWKPWRDRVLYLAAEHQNTLQAPARRYTIVRASASFLNAGRYSDDWHPARTWVSQNLFVDAVQRLDARYAAFTVDYRTSLHRRFAERQSLEPYVHVQVNAVATTAFSRDVRGGAGLRWNLWHGGTRYTADPHKLSVGLEFQQAFETYLDDADGVLVTAGWRW